MFQASKGSSDANQRLDILNEKISTLTAALDTLTQEREIIMADVRTHSVILSPLRLLPTLTSLRRESAGKNASRKVVALIDARAKFCRKMEFWGLMMDIHTNRRVYTLLSTSPSCIEVQRLRDAGLKIHLLELNQRLQRAIHTDPYSLQRCNNYSGITTPKLWDSCRVSFSAHQLP